MHPRDRLRKYSPLTKADEDDQRMGEIMVEEIAKAQGFTGKVRQAIYERWIAETGKTFSMAKNSYLRCQNRMNETLDAMSNVLDCFAVFDRALGRLDNLAEQSNMDRDKIAANREITAIAKNKLDFIQKHFSDITNKEKNEILKEKIIVEAGTRLTELHLNYENMKEEDLEKKLLNSFMGRPSLVNSFIERSGDEAFKAIDISDKITN